MSLLGTDFLFYEKLVINNKVVSSVRMLLINLRFFPLINESESVKINAQEVHIH